MMKNKLLVAASIILNLIFIIHSLYNTFTIWNPTWTNRAAAEAEVAASVSCSGHGRAYVDGIGVLDGNKPPCECNSCYTGKDCSILVKDCPVDASAGDPLFLEPFWMRQAEKSAVLVSGWHRMSYLFQDGSYVSAELERIIRKLHKVVGNAVTDDRFIIFGTGATQLIAASVHALSQINSSSSPLKGDPLFLEPFWMRQAEKSAVLVSGWHRMSYLFQDGSYVSAELERIIRKLHKVVGNAVTDDRFIIFGTGATQLIAASVHALSQINSSSSPLRLLASIPYYNIYKDQAEFFDSTHLKFEGDASAWKKSKGNDNITQVIEIVTSPNNPDGKMKRAVLDGPNVKTIHDYAYYWPYYSPITNLTDEDLSLFSLSKATGHAGSRFG
ncbi:unnamed protein product [Microthlaspi erraticum]|uniref:Alliinase C-terminal domain-containing protein n=1 Tax=Microthlaspi erraticum TaxID=1685480 RepID=A0A6D2JTV7_9BRAS|nr:unnamed protein product [Microthlaspi erraticum]